MSLQPTEVKEIPAAKLAPWSEAEFARTSEAQKQALTRKSDRVWSITRDGELVVIAGVLVPALVSRPELWFLLCESFTENLRSNLLASRELMEDLLDLYPAITVRVDSAYPAGDRFARFMGFSLTHYSLAPDGREYGIYEVTR